MKKPEVKLGMVLFAAVVMVAIWQYRLHLKHKRSIEYVDNYLETRYQQSKQMNFNSLAIADSFPIPVFEKSYEPIMDGAKPIGYIQEFEEVMYLKKESTCYQVQLNQKDNKSVGFIHIRHSPKRNSIRTP